MIHHFPEEFTFELPDRFTDPFRYVPHISVQVAAKQIVEFIESQSGLADELAEGKMMGVLVCRTKDTDICFVAAFSGNVGGKNHIEGFVPPIFNLLDPNGYFKTHEAEITDINLKIKTLSTSAELESARNNLKECTLKRDCTLAEFREIMAASKAERTRLRSAEGSGASDRQANSLSAELEQKLIRESQFEKAEFKRLKTALQADVDAAQQELDKLLAEITSLKKARAEMSDNLQDWIFRQYIVHNGNGTKKSIAEIFASDGLTPPGGTGECAAPKLLEYAYRNGLQPLAMGEFWYGKASDTAVRTHGHFYPSCTSKCGPLLGYMLKGLRGIHNGTAATQESCDTKHPQNAYELQSAGHGKTSRPPQLTDTFNTPVIIYEDSHILVTEKPSGMPSVPGLDGRVSLEEWLNERSTDCKITAVHRLDMDTSGVLVFAKTPEAESNLKMQFENRTVSKTYMARLRANNNTEVDSRISPTGVSFQSDSCTQKANTLFENRPLAKGTIELPLSPDYDERPRQKVDFKQGKEAKTEYELVNENPDGTIDILFHPVTGRTHQLRVHSAHHLGLGRPIVGDLLYGGWSIDQTILYKKESQTPRLHLHSFSISFCHPSTGEPLTFSSTEPWRTTP